VLELKKAIDVFLKKNDLEKGVKQNNAIIIWEQIVGEKIAENTKADSVEFGILTVKVETPTWRQELIFKKQEILGKINHQLGQNTIREIRFI
jgi:predicted nucleic acid-binding Zn ribbon protein